MTYDAVVVGGGLSGLSAAVAMSAAGGRVAVVEQGPRLGGRCYSYADPVTGDEVDNGQHVLLGSYHHLLKYLDTIGSSTFLRRQPALELPFHHPERGFGTFRLRNLPVPFDLATGMLTYRLLSPREKKDLLLAGNMLRSWNRAAEQALSGMSVSGWLDSLGQGQNARDCFWDPISISVMNENPGAASALLFAKTLRATFFERGADSRMLISTVGQTKLYVDGAVDFLAARKSIVRTRTGAARLLARDTGGRAGPRRVSVAGVILEGGEEIRSGCVISAVPHWALASLVPDSDNGKELIGLVNSLSTSPIVSVHLWFDRSFMESELVGVIGRTIQWAFDRRRIITGGGGTTSMISCVVSAARELSSQPVAQIVDTVVADLRSIYPRATRASLTRSVGIKEKRATFSPVPGVEKFRPGALTGIEGFYLAGDWTETGFPATIEGAVKSGIIAAGHARDGTRGKDVLSR